MQQATRIAGPTPSAPPRIRLTDAQRQQLIERSEAALAILAGSPGKILVRISDDEGPARKITVVSVSVSEGRK